MMRFCPECATPLEQRPFEGKPRPTCPNCGYIVFADPKVAATVLIERAGMLLLTRRAIDPGRGLWSFPGGYVDFGEDPEVAAARECREETGLTVVRLALLDVSFNGRVIVITYTAQAVDDAEPMPADDADMVGWFVPDSLPPLAFESMHRAIGLWREKNKEQRTGCRAQRAPGEQRE
ncbi:MAG TPA: NUDIX hydrolase [Herpetosiphonaceae bacterium]